MTRRLSTLDDAYLTGDLSVFPSSIDSKTELYEVKNNAETNLRSSLPYNGKFIVVDSTSSFPDQGIIRVGAGVGSSLPAELVYYGSKTNNTFKNLTRGFAGSRQNQWPVGSWVTNAVTAEPHNAVKDAILNIESKVGIKNNPATGSLNARLKNLEAKYLAPKASFRAYPKSGKVGTSVRFQTFCEGDIIRYLWDLGDGTQTTEQNPSHVYLAEGLYTVKLNIITSTGAQGIYTKSNYITISNDEVDGFFYTKLKRNPFPYETLPLSSETANLESKLPGTFRFIDQTDGDIKARYWIFGDGSSTIIENDPNQHETTHVYEKPGEYLPSLLITFADERVRRTFLSNSLVVT